MVSVIVDYLREHPEGLTRDNIIEELGISITDFYNRKKRNKLYYKNINGKFFYINPFEALPSENLKLEKMSETELIHECAKYRIFFNLQTKNQQEKIMKLYLEYIKPEIDYNEFKKKLDRFIILWKRENKINLNKKKILSPNYFDFIDIFFETEKENIEKGWKLEDNIYYNYDKEIQEWIEGDLNEIKKKSEQLDNIENTFGLFPSEFCRYREDLKTKMGWSRKEFWQLYPTYDHYKNPKRYNLPSFYDNPYWVIRRAQILKRDNHICADCGEWGDEVDHLNNVYYRSYICLAPHNLETICVNCHNKRTQNRYDAWKKRRERSFI